MRCDVVTADPVMSFRYGIGASYDEADPLAQILPLPAAEYEEADPLPLSAPVPSDEQPIFFTRADAGTVAERRLLHA